MGSKSYSKGISWIDDCRIGFEDRQNQQKIFANGNGGVYKETNSSKNEYVSVKGRFPANILVSDDMLNDGNISSIKQNKDYIPPNEANSIHNYSRGKYSGIQDKGTNSRYYDIDKWFDKLLDV